MKVVYAFAAAVTAAFVYQQGFLNPTPGVDPVTVSSISADATASERFQVLAGGVNNGCVVTANGDGPRKDLTLTPACERQMPALGKVKWWVDRDDGSVAFVNASGTILAEFTAGDGAALESFAPRDPMLALFAL